MGQDRSGRMEVRHQIVLLLAIVVELRVDLRMLILLSFVVVDVVVAAAANSCCCCCICYRISVLISPNARARRPN